MKQWDKQIYINTNSLTLGKIFHNNIKAFNKTKIKKLLYSIPQFILALNPIVEQNELNMHLNKHHKEQHKANVIIRKKQSKVELTRYLHTACLSPTLSTFIIVIKITTSSHA